MGYPPLVQTHNPASGAKESSIQVGPDQGDTGTWHKRGLVDGASHAEDIDDAAAVAMMVAMRKLLQDAVAYTGPQTGGGSPPKALHQSDTSDSAPKAAGIRRCCKWGTLLPSCRPTTQQVGPKSPLSESDPTEGT